MSATLLAQVALGLAALPAVLAAINLIFYRYLPSANGACSIPVSVLIPARDEEARIEPALRSVLANRNVPLELLVLDDHSRDRTASIVHRVRDGDSRVRLIDAKPLPPGWSGKQHACAQLAAAARHDVLLFIDADVRLTPDAIARMVQRLESGKAALISGFPRQITETLVERMVIPLIHVLLLGFLPLIGMRFFVLPGFGAACGQLIMVRRAAYEDAGGHGAIKSSRHDGLTLPRVFRRHRHMTDLFDATDIASCRMYEGAVETWNGFMKNATEGMATPVALPVWTALLFGGQVLPMCLIVYGSVAGMESQAWTAAVAAVLLSYGLRMGFSVRFRQSWTGAVIHPIGVLVVLVIQWIALGREIAGLRTSWRGRI